MPSTPWSEFWGPRPIPAIVPFYKDERQLNFCLSALAQQTTPVTPWVHDNSSINLYYTQTQNLGMKRAIREDYPFAILLTQDVYLRPDAVRRVLAFMHSHPRCAIAGIKQLSSRDEDLIVHGGCGRAFPSGRHYGGRKSQGHCAVSARMPWVNGACLVARLEAVIEFGLMDANLKMLGSDSDWCYTARARGWEVWYCADAEGIHEAGVTSGARSPDLQAVFDADVRYWRDKWVGSALLTRLEREVPPPGPPYTHQPLVYPS